MKILFVKRNMLLSVSALAVAGLLVSMTSNKNNNLREEIESCNNPDLSHVCIMKTIFGLDSSQEQNLISTFKTTEKVQESIKKGLIWTGKAQGNDGGWGAGSHYNQGVTDPYAVPSDPGTTSLVAMSLLRTDNTLTKGEYSKNLKKSVEFLLKQVEECPDSQPYLTKLENTQPQIKLGRNIDVILTAQFFTNILRYDINDAQLKKHWINVWQEFRKDKARMEAGETGAGRLYFNQLLPIMH